MSNIHFHKRNLPHIYLPTSTYFITYRLKGTIPLKILEKLKNKYITLKKPKIEKYNNEKLFFAEYDNYLDNNRNIQHLKNKNIVKIVQESLHHYDKITYNLICYTIMPNHVHLVFHLLEQKNENVPQTFQSVNKIITQTEKNTILETTEKNITIDKIMKSIKGYSAREANKLLNKKGNFWQSESFDHIVRNDDELIRIIKYVLYNPVKAGLVENWGDWNYTFLSEDWRE